MDAEEEGVAPVRAELEGVERRLLDQQSGRLNPERAALLARRDALDGREHTVRGDEAWAAALAEDSAREAGAYTRPLLSST
jgi:hypothetical protein